MTPKATGKRNTWIGPLCWMFVLALVMVLIGMLPTAWEVRAHGLTLSQSRNLTQAQVKAIIVKEAKAAHLSTANTAALLWIAKRESNYHAFSSNHGKCLGVFQLSKAMCRGWNWYDPALNTRRAIRYIHGRYKTPLKAEAFWQRHHWY